MEHHFLDQLITGQEIMSYYIVNRAQVKKGKNTDFIEMELQDKTGPIRAVMWEVDMNVFNELKQNAVAKVLADVAEFRERQELHVKKIRMITEEDEIDWTCLIETSNKDIDKLIENFEDYLSKIENPFLIQLMNSIFNDDELKNKFYSAPAGKKWHHCYKHGLLEHVVNMLHLANTMKKFYSELNLDLLISGVILHDFGKLWEYDSEISIDFSDIGRLNGHIAMGYRFAINEMDKIENFPENLKQQMGHLILSHQGSFEKASPILPMTLEAIVLHYIDELDAETNAVSRVLQKDRMPGSKLTRYNQMMGRFFYKDEDI